MLRQLFYVSRAADALSDAEVRNILRVSQRNNRHRDLTGCLMYSGRHFAQILEGETVAVSELVARIVDDPRHTGCVVLVDRETRIRMHPDWSMGFLYKLDLADRLETLLGAEPLSNDQALDVMAGMKADSVMGSL